jgi:hypothetical protein
VVSLAERHARFALGASCTVGPSGLLFDSQVVACEEGQSALGLCGHCTGGRARSMRSEVVPPLERRMVLESAKRST